MARWRAAGQAGRQGASEDAWPRATNRVCTLPNRLLCRAVRASSRVGDPLRPMEHLVPKVIASSVRKGNVIDLDGKLCVVMSAENIHPGKGTPVTHLVMRRIADGVKTEMRYKTTDSVERAYLENKDYNYLYEDDMGYNSMQPETFEQISISKDIIGDQSQWLQEGMTCDVSLHEGNPIAIELPPRVTLEITEADPVVKGLTASSSYK